MPRDQVETENELITREAREKENAEAAARSQASTSSQPVPEQSFMQYMQLVEERRQRDQEVQNMFMHHIISQNREQGRDNGGRGVSLSDFQNTRLLSFVSTAKPMDAENWLRDTERKLDVVGSNDEEKLQYTSYMLTGPAACWWETVLTMKPAGTVISWAEFKGRFRNTHVPDSIMELKRREFESVLQNDFPILQYVREFSELSRYAPDEVDTEEKRVKRFMKGLNPYMRMQLRLTRHHKFQEIVDATITLEDDYKSVQEERSKKAWAEPKHFPERKPNPI
jgi:hypothetical protein